MHRLFCGALDGDYAAIRAHDPHKARAGLAGKSVQVTRHYGRHIRVHDSGRYPLVLAVLWEQSGGNGDGDADRGERFRYPIFVYGIGVRVEEHHRERLGAAHARGQVRQFGGV